MLAPRPLPLCAMVRVREEMDNNQNSPEAETRSVEVAFPLASPPPELREVSLSFVELLYFFCVIFSADTLGRMRKYARNQCFADLEKDVS